MAESRWQAGRRFSSDQVTDIVRRALEHGGSDDVSYDDLEEIARQSGISAGRLQAAVEEHDRLGKLEWAREEWRRRRKSQFFGHLRCYLIVNGILLLMNIATGPSDLWVIWPILGWGFGIAFDASEAFFPSEEAVERGARRILRKRKNDLRHEGGSVQFDVETRL